MVVTSSTAKAEVAKALREVGPTAYWYLLKELEPRESGGNARRITRYELPGPIMKSVGGLELLIK